MATLAEAFLADLEDLSDGDVSQEQEEDEEHEHEQGEDDEVSGGRQIFAAAAPRWRKRHTCMPSSCHTDANYVAGSLFCAADRWATSRR